MTTEQKPIGRVIIETLVFAALIPPTFIAWKLAQLDNWWRARRRCNDASCAKCRGGEPCH